MYTSTSGLPVASPRPSSSGAVARVGNDPHDTANQNTGRRTLDRSYFQPLSDLSSPSLSIWKLLIPATIPLGALWTALTGSELDKVVVKVRSKALESFYPWSCNAPLGIVIDCLDSDIVRNVIVGYMNMGLSQKIPEFYPGLWIVDCPAVSEFVGVNQTIVRQVLMSLYWLTIEGDITSIAYLRPATYAANKKILEHLEAPLDSAECGLFCELGGWLKWGAIFLGVGIGAWALYEITSVGISIRKAVL